MSPKMARFIRGKVKRGGYTNASEVVRTALRRMQEEAREARLARSAADDILAALSGDDRAHPASPAALGTRREAPATRGRAAFPLNARGDPT